MNRRLWSPSSRSRLQATSCSRFTSGKSQLFLTFAPEIWYPKGLVADPFITFLTFILLTFFTSSHLSPSFFVTSPSLNTHRRLVHMPPLTPPPSVKSSGRTRRRRRSTASHPASADALGVKKKRPLRRLAPPPLQGLFDDTVTIAVISKDIDGSTKALVVYRKLCCITLPFFSRSLVLKALPNFSSSRVSC